MNLLLLLLNIFLNFWFQCVSLPLARCAKRLKSPLHLPLLAFEEQLECISLLLFVACPYALLADCLLLAHLPAYLPEWPLEAKIISMGVSNDSAESNSNSRHELMNISKS